jgi:hypothetical protein
MKFRLASNSPSSSLCLLKTDYKPRPHNSRQVLCQWAASSASSVSFEDLIAHLFFDWITFHCMDVLWLDYLSYCRIFGCYTSDYCYKTYKIRKLNKIKSRNLRFFSSKPTLNSHSQAAISLLVVFIGGKDHNKYSCFSSGHRLLFIPICVASITPCSGWKYLLS